jgi:hypothetical protein
MKRALFRTLWPAIAVLACAASAVSAAPMKPPENPAKITLEVAPEVVAPGGDARVTVQLAPIDGIKIARYPQIKLKVPAQEGLTGEALATIGSAKPPPPDKLATNYWKDVDPVVLTLQLDDSLAAGDHEVEAKLTYYYCVSGNFCAPKRVPLKIPLDVR